MTDIFTIKDSGKREEFETGSRRDTEDDKLDWTLLPFTAMERLVRHLMKGAKKYGRHNWTLGQSMARAERSLLRHVRAYLGGERDEDHLSAAAFNLCLLLDHEERIAAGELPKTLDDRDEWRRADFAEQLFSASDLELKAGVRVRILAPLYGLADSAHLVGTFAFVREIEEGRAVLEDLEDATYEGCFAMPAGVEVIG